MDFQYGKMIRDVMLDKLAKVAQSVYLVPDSSDTCDMHENDKNCRNKK